MIIVSVAAYAHIESTNNLELLMSEHDNVLFMLLVLYSRSLRLRSDCVQSWNKYATQLLNFNIPRTVWILI